MSEGISIIIPTYNRSSLLRKVLCGLVAQQFYSDQFEIIIIDNGSEEDILKKISDFKNKLNIVFIKRRLRKNHFRPASARNIGVSIAKYNLLLFLDSDCVPSEKLLYYHSKAHKCNTGLVTIGHRIFINKMSLKEHLILNGKYMNVKFKPVKSHSNYLQEIDRRIPELKILTYHRAPYNCLHACNVALGKEEFYDAGMFDEAFDGHWGYEDIEFGYRMFLKGANFSYLPKAIVYHLEGEGLSLSERLEGKNRNYALACKKIPDFDLFRKNLGR